MFDLKRIRPLDAAIAVVLVLVVALGAYLGYTMWSNSRKVQASTPSARTVQELINAVKKNPDDLAMRWQLAQALAYTGDRDEAVKQFKIILKVEPEYAPAFAGLGLVALQEKDFGVAESYYRKAIKVYGAADQQSSFLEESYFYLGTALMEQKEYEEAAGYFKAALRIKRDSSTTHYLLAVCLRELELDEAYRESLQNTLLFDPRHPEANYDLGKVLLSEGKIAEAAERFRISVDAAPAVALPKQELEKLGTVESRITSARGYVDNDPKNALIQARIAVAIDPRSADAFVVLGDAWLAAGNKPRARDAYKRALGIDAEHDAAKAALERVDDGA